MDTEKKSNNNIKISIIILFIIIIYFPIIQFKLNFITFEEMDENRNKYQVPILSLDAIKSGKYMVDFEKYYNDHFGFRELFIRMSNNIDIKLFNTSPNKNVIIGKNGFIYYSPTLNDYYKHATLTDTQISKIAKKLRKLQDDLHKTNIKFLFLVAPNKSTIYPEYMPYKREISGNSSNYDKLLIELEKENVNHINIFPILFSQKDKYDLYYSRDTHWNYISGFITSREILKYLYKLNSIDYVDSQIISFETKEFNGDLDKMMGIKNKTKELVPNIKYNDIPVKLPKVYWYHDSFSEKIFPFVEPYFSEVISYYHNKNEDQRFENTFVPNMQETKIFVFEVVERTIPSILNSDFDFLDYREEDIENNYRSYLLNLQKPDNVKQVTISNDITGNLLVTSSGEDPYLLWKLPFIKSVEYLVIEFIKTPQEIIPAQVYWTTKSDNIANEDKSKKFTIKPGKNKYIVNMGKNDSVATIRVDLGVKENINYLIKSIKIYYN